MKKAKDIMTPNPKMVQSGHDLKDAITFFLENNLHYSPVISPMGDVLGLLSEFSLVKASLRVYLEPNKHEKVAHHVDTLEPMEFISEDATLDEVVKTLTKSPTHRILVRGKNNKVVGIISPKDILLLVSGAERNALDLRKELEKTREQAADLSDKLETLEETTKIYKNLFEDSPHMMHAVDKNGRIVMANKAIHRKLGYEDGELIGKMLTDLYPKSVLHEAISGLKKIEEEGQHQMTYTTMVRKNGAKIRVDIASSALRDEYGKFISTITISREVDSEALLRALHGVVGGKIDLRQIDEEEI